MDILVHFQTNSDSLCTECTVPTFTLNPVSTHSLEEGLRLSFISSHENIYILLYLFQLIKKKRKSLLLSALNNKTFSQKTVIIINNIEYRGLLLAKLMLTFLSLYHSNLRDGSGCNPPLWQHTHTHTRGQREWAFNPTKGQGWSEFNKCV